MFRHCRSDAKDSSGSDHDSLKEEKKRAAAAARLAIPDMAEAEAAE